MLRFAVIALFACVLFCAPVAQAGFECEKHWDGPSENNTIGDCKLDQLYANRPRQMAPIVISLAVLVVTFLVFPFVWCCRQCFCNCCGSSHRRPGYCCCPGGSSWDDAPEEEIQAMYTECDVRCAKMSTGVIWLLGGAALLLMVIGGARLMDAYDSFWLELQGLVDWAETQITNVQTTMTLPNGELVPGFPIESIESALNATAKLRADMAEWEETSDQYGDQASAVAIGVGVGPIVLFVFGACFAVCDIRTCLPALFSWFYYLFCIVYCLLALVFLLLGGALADVCDEIELQLEGKPGLMQWWIVPKCMATIDMGTIQENVRSAERSNAIRGCEHFATMCSPGDLYSLSDPDKIYVCGITDPAVQCLTFDALQGFLNNSKGKTQDLFQVCTSVPNDECSVPKCAEQCVRVSQLNAANNTVNAVDYASRAIRSFDNYVVPLLDCDKLINVGLRPFKKCRVLEEGANATGAGCLIYGILFAIGIIVLLRGQKRFFKRIKADPVETDPYKTGGKGKATPPPL